MNQLRFHILLHASFESPGYLLDLIKNNGHKAEFTRIYNDESLPEHSMYDVLIVMGGPMGVNDESIYPWLNYEKRFIREAINLGKKVMGICLGSQLIASALGAKVYANVEKEIGFFKIHNKDQQGIFKNLPQEMQVFHWHGDTYDLPEKAVLLAESEATPHQAFFYEPNVLALQFHPEITETLLDEFLYESESELKPAKFIQSKEQIMNGYVYIPTCHVLMDEIFKSFVNNQS
jgi:GMP synthase-like glutamine amidotransferase